MDSGSKILIIEDDPNDLNIFLKACKDAKIITEEQLKKLDPLGKDDYFKDTSFPENIVVAKSFKDGDELINTSDNGAKYACIFIDRKLEGEEYNNAPEDIKNDFEFLGDYLCGRAQQYNIPSNKLYFLTNNPKIEENENQLKANNYYCHLNDVPIISKNNNNSNLSEILANLESVKIRHLYRDIFDNTKVKEIFDPYIENFITTLAKQYDKNTKYVDQDGANMRKMLECIVTELDFSDSVREYLNKKVNCYNFNPQKAIRYPQAAYKNWLEDYQCLGKIIHEEDVLKKYYQNNKNQTKEAAEIQAKNFIDISNEIHNIIMSWLNMAYRGKKAPNNTPPKYIFSYIDNIYTVTSEWSAHGTNDKTTNALTPQGWQALTYGMIQILQWVANNSKCFPCKKTGTANVQTNKGTQCCSDCKGRGVKFCPACNGTGLYKKSKSCTRCNGRGKVICDNCDGTGYA